MQQNNKNNEKPRVIRGTPSPTHTSPPATSRPAQKQVIRKGVPVTSSYAESMPEVKSKKKLKTSAKVLISIASAFMAIIIVIVFLFMYYFGGLKTNKLNVGKDDLNINSEIVGKYGNKKIVNIAFFGIDTRNNDNKGRSDAIMILSIDNEHNKLKLTSIARDTYVSIPGRAGKDKINHAYNYGGPELAIKTLNFNFGMDIEDYVTVNFAQLADVIDVVDGATVDLTEDERLAANENMQTIGISNQDIKRGTSGVVRLNGTQAVAYSRIRVIGGDTQRTDRQREVLNSLFSDIKQKKTIEYPGLVKKILPMVVTSLSYTDIIGLAPIMLKGDIPLVQTSFPHKINQAKGQTINGTWYFVYDLEKAQDVLHKFIYEDIHPDDQTE